MIFYHHGLIDDPKHFDEFTTHLMHGIQDDEHGISSTIRHCVNGECCQREPWLLTFHRVVMAMRERGLDMTGKALHMIEKPEIAPSRN